MNGAQPHAVHAVRRPSRAGSVGRREDRGGRMEFFRQGCAHWFALNGNELAWIALVTGGVVFTTWVMRWGG